MKKPSLSLQDNGRIYLDHNATTPPLRSVVEKLPEWAQYWGNPSSIHWNGRGPKSLIRNARSDLAKLLRCHPVELIFTSGGSEANNTVIKGFYEVQENPSRTHYITTRVEHPSVLSCFEYLKSRGATVHYLSVDRNGKIDLEEYTRLLNPSVALVSVMAANNETGSVFPIAQMTEMAHAVGASFHTDAVQALGKIPVDVQAWGVDFATFAGHKVHALKGTGIIYSRRGRRLGRLLSGGGQERGRRAGTENLLSIASFGHVAQWIPEMVGKQTEEISDLRDFLEVEIQMRISGVRITGSGVRRLPNTSSLVIDGVDGESLLINLDIEGVAVSTGAACSSGNPEPSPVLLAMGLTRAEAQRSLRLSLGIDTSKEDIEKFLDVLERVVTRLRQLSTEAIGDVSPHEFR